MYEFLKHYENFQKLKFFENTFIKDKSELKFALVVELAQLKFTYITVVKYRTLAIISRGLYFFYPFFTKAVAYTADNLCTKQGNVGPKSAAFKQERLQIKSGL